MNRTDSGFFGGLRWLVAVAGLWVLAGCSPESPRSGVPTEAGVADYVKLSREGKKFYSADQAERAIPLFEAAAKLEPLLAQAHVNLANAYLLNGQAELALAAADRALNIETNLPAAVYVKGCATLRMGRAEEAILWLARAKAFDPTVNPVSYQLARAYQDVGRWDYAVTNLEEVVLFDPDHKAAHFNLSQAYVRQGRREEGAAELEEHRRATADLPGPPDASDFESCTYTRIVVPLYLDYPSPEGVPVRFVDATEASFGAAAGGYRGPLAVLDLNRTGLFSVLAREGQAGFRLLLNTNGGFEPRLLPFEGRARYARALVGDLNNDRVDDVVLIGEEGSQVFQFATNGVVRDQTRFSRMDGVTAGDGLLADLDYTGKLDLLLAGGTNSFQALRNLGPPYFVDNTTNFSVENLSAPRGFMVEDWNGDDLLDVVVGQEQGAVLLARQRDGRFVVTNAMGSLPAGPLMAMGDLNQDLKPDLVVLGGDELVCVLAEERLRVPLEGWSPSGLELIDYDNDGWLDLVAFGKGMRVWRNLGPGGFGPVEIGLEGVNGEVEHLVAADFDGDCDTDLVISLAGGGVSLWRNEGGNANRQLKLNLMGTRSNSSALGIRVEVAADGLQLARRVSRLPVEIGVGKNVEIDSVTVHWFDFTQNTIDVRSDRCDPLPLIEFQKQTGSCPYLYAWDGGGFRFVTDLLGGSPLGLPLSEGRLVGSEPDELVWLGDDSLFPARDGQYVVQVTEELREALYLDAARLVVVDHPAGTEVYTTGKLVPRKPFPRSEIVTLHRPRPLLGAWDGEGRDVTERLREADARYVSPLTLRVSQLRGLAEPYSVVMDFGPLEVEKPLVLAISAWLRFGGGSVNIAASHDPDLPFPFPRLEVETGSGEWKAVDVEVGAPAGKPKSYVVELGGLLPKGSGRLRLTTAFEIHWDRIALLEKRDNSATRIHRLTPSLTDLHWRGFSEDQDLPWYQPITPNYAVVNSKPLWRTAPEGWCTRYGEVDELLAERDNALVVLVGGDELTLGFAASEVPAKPEGGLRDFFFYSSGWDKDMDVHCTLGWQVEPLPWHGMDDQLYGLERRPKFENDGWIEKYNTRWTGAAVGAPVR